MTSKLSHLQEVSSNYIMDYKKAEEDLGKGEIFFNLASQCGVIPPLFLEQLLDGGDLEDKLISSVLRQIEESTEKIRELLND